MRVELSMLYFAVHVQCQYKGARLQNSNTNKRTRKIVKTNDNANKETRAARVGAWFLVSDSGGRGGLKNVPSTQWFHYELGSI